MNGVCNKQKVGHVERQLVEWLSVAYGLRFKRGSLLRGFFSIGGMGDFEVEDDSVCLGLGNALDVRVHEENVGFA